MNYERIIGDLNNPTYRDVSLTVYHDDDDDDEEIYSIYLWFDYEKKTFKVDKGCFHSEPLEKELIDELVKTFCLEKFMIASEESSSQ